MSYYRSEACFRRYEQYIVKACLSYPQTVWFRSERAIATDAARCRDAITSFKTFKWSASVDPTAYEAVLNELRVMQFMGYVVIAPVRVANLMGKHMRAQAMLFGFDLSAMYEPDMKKAQDAFAREYKRAQPAVKMTSTADEIIAATVPQISTTDVSLKSIEEAVDMINNGDVKGEYICQLTDENLARTIAAIGDKLNVAYVRDEAKQIIKIF